MTGEFQKNCKGTIFMFGCCKGKLEAVSLFVCLGCTVVNFLCVQMIMFPTYNCR